MIFYGRNIVLEALKSKYKAHEIFIEKNINRDEKITLILDAAKAAGVTIRTKDRKEISHITKSQEHQGVAIDLNYHIEAINKNDIRQDSAYMYISDATFEHNVGAIIRTCEVAGFAGVILPKNLNITPVIAKTSAGGIFHLNIYKEAVFNCIKKFKDADFNIYGIERNGNTYYEQDLTGSSLFIIGSEHRSLSETIQKKCDNILEIPQLGNVNSLNMSVAASVVIFERLRQNSIVKQN